MGARVWRLQVLVVVVVATIVLVASGSVTSRAAESPSLTIDPTFGLPGTTIHVSGTGCPDSSWDISLTWLIHVQIRPAGSTPSAGVVTQPSGTPMTPIAFTAEGYVGRADAFVTPAGDGTWSTDITIPGTGDLAAVAGNYPIDALCYAQEGAEAGTIGYAAQTFAVPVIDYPPPPPPRITNPNFTG
jgi:hypothetical protein